MQRASLQPFPPDTKFSVLPWQPPTNDRRFLRANSWAVTMPGAPWVLGASQRHPERILSWFLDRYAADFQLSYLTKTASYGYTHVKQSLGDSMGPKNNGPDRTPGNEQTIDQVAATLRRVHSVRSAVDGLPLSVSLMLGSKDFHPHSMSLPEYQSIFGPLLDRLFAQGALKAGDELLSGWEWDLWNQGTPGATTVAIMRWVGDVAHARGLTSWNHFSGHVTSWFADGDPRGRFGFWQDLGSSVDGINYQTIPTWSMRDTQDRIVDTLWQFGEEGNVHRLRLDEDQASLQWDNDQPDEAAGDVRGYLACCTIDDVKRTDAKVWGYGNGGSRPDGSVL